jgi:glycosyltransferase involved in cell wall biosynthesis
VFPITFESLISRGRNAAVAHFLSDPEATHLLFIDSDIEFETEAVIKLINADKEVICAGYAQKWLREDLIQRVFTRDIVPPQPLELCTHTSIQLTRPTNVEDVKEIVEIEYATTGFLLIKREVFDKMRQVHPHRKYINDIDGYMSANPDAFYDFFPATIRESTRRFESEDFGFSRLWKECGGTVYLHTNVSLRHHGWFGFPANIYRQLTDHAEQETKKNETVDTTNSQSQNQETQTN